MGQLLTRARRVLQGKLAGLRQGGTAAHPAGGAFDPGFEPEHEDTGSGNASGAAQHPAQGARARALGILEVTPGVTPDELRSAYRKLCRRYHPDRFDHDAAKSRAANELLAEVNAAYDLLKGEPR